LYSFLLLLTSLMATNSAIGQDLTIHPTFNNIYGAGSFDDLYAVLGGTGNEALFDMIQTSDGGYALVGQTRSMASCDVPAGNLFVADAWVVKLNALGNITWTSRFGSAQNDNATSIIETSDGGFLIGGDTIGLQN